MTTEKGDKADDCWKVFGDDDDDGESDCSDLEPRVDNEGIIVEAATEATLHLTKTFVHEDPSIPLHYRYVLHHSATVATQEGSEIVAQDQKSELTLSNHVQRMIKERGFNLKSEGPCVDAAILSLGGIHDHDRNLKKVIQFVVPGGWLIILSLSTSTFNESNCSHLYVLDRAIWNLDDAKTLFNKMTAGDKFCYAIAVKKREGLINTLACPWKYSGSNHKDQELLAYERFVLSETTAGRSAYERSLPFYHLNSMTSASKRKSVAALQKYGFCVVRDIVPKTDVRLWHDAVLDDIVDAIDVLKKKHNVDLLQPGRTASDPVSYRELAMREDLRVDLRLGPCIRKMRQQEQNKEQEDRASGFSSSSNLQNHPALLDIAQSAMNPKGKHFRGNFGRWNFGGTGPDGTPQTMRVGEIGAVISFPGCGDQAIHADTPHLFEHINDLPPHYINLFLPTIEQAENAECQTEFNGESRVGGTAFLAETHKLDVCERVTEDSNRPEKLRRIIRPSLNIGDALLFDCRVLHFGLANNNHHSSAESGFEDHSLMCDHSRPLLYMNLTHSWFSDPKNWDDRERLFPNLD